MLHTNPRLGPKGHPGGLRCGHGLLHIEYDGMVTAGAAGTPIENLGDPAHRAESALVVNNNAAAVMLILGAMTKGRKWSSPGSWWKSAVSFRCREIMEQSGSILVEVGSTNKTHLSDYEKAITETPAPFSKSTPATSASWVSTESVPHQGHGGGCPRLAVCRSSTTWAAGCSSTWNSSESGAHGATKLYAGVDVPPPSAGTSC